MRKNPIIYIVEGDMNLIKEYFTKKNIADYKDPLDWVDDGIDQKFDKYRNTCMKMASGFVGKKKKLLSTKDEIKDLQQDTIVAFIEAMNEFDENKGHFLGLYMFKLKTLEQSFIARYCGLGMSYQDYLMEKRENRDIVINKLPFWDEYFDE